MTQTPQPFSPEYLAIWPQGLQEWIQEVSPRLEDITSIQFDAEVIDLGVNEHGWRQKAAGPHRYITLIAQGKTYKQTFKRQEHGEWERV
jgi:hypothetical protein